MASRVIKNKTSEFISSLLVSKGDLMTRDSNSVVRLPVGTDGQVLTADSTQAAGLKWATVSGGGSGTPHAPEVFTVNATIISTLQVGLSAIPISDSLFVILNGSVLDPSNYVLIGTIIQFVPAIGFVLGDIIDARYQT